MKRKQAERANQAQIEMHIVRQQHLGERMIGDKDQPQRWELIATFSVIFLISIGTLRGWW